MKLYERLPVRVNVREIAAGVIEMTRSFSEDSGTDYMQAMTFGMLPGPLMDMLKKSLIEKFCKEFKATDPSLKLTRLKRIDSVELFDEVEFTINELVSEILHDVSLEMYSLTPMVA